MRKLLICTFFLWHNLATYIFYNKLTKNAIVFERLCVKF